MKTGQVDFYEIFGSRNVVFYWRGFHEYGVVKISFDVVANIPGSFTGMASVVYLYYTPGIHRTKKTEKEGRNKRGRRRKKRKIKRRKKSKKKKR